MLSFLLLVDIIYIVFVSEVFYEGETEPVYYDRIWPFIIGDGDVVNEVKEKGE